ncbi:hypothetical protein [Anaerostipes sp. 992a]|nr:hypothetical protein [Anaerostipes sp. 992a]
MSKKKVLYVLLDVSPDLDVKEAQELDFDTRQCMETDKVRSTG